MFACIYRNGAGETEEVEIEVEIRGNYTPRTPGKIYGPPEDCYPEEGGYASDMVAVFVDGKKERFIELTKEEELNFEDNLAEELAEIDADRYDEAREYWAEAREEHYND